MVLCNTLGTPTASNWYHFMADVITYPVLLRMQESSSPVYSSEASSIPLSEEMRRTARIISGVGPLARSAAMSWPGLYHHLFPTILGRSKLSVPPNRKVAAQWAPKLLDEDPTQLLQPNPLYLIFLRNHKLDCQILRGTSVTYAPRLEVTGIVIGGGALTAE